MSAPDVPRINADLAVLMHERLGIRRGESLSAKLSHAGRLVPKAERKAGQTLIAAEKLWDNPKLRRQVDPSEIGAAERRLRLWLDTVDAADRRKGMIIGILASIAFNVLVVAAALIVWMVWSGRL